MAAIQCSASHASCQHGADGPHRAAQPLTTTTRAFFSSHSVGERRLGSGGCELQGSCLARNSAVTLLKRAQRRKPVELNHGIWACHGAPPATSSSRSGGGDVLTSLAIAIAIPVVSGVVASLFNSANLDWYKGLRKPGWNPPDWLFGAAWGLLYGVMGVASWLVWAQGGWEVQGHALSLYALQLLLNLAWPALFFGAKRMLVALVDIIALWLSLLACIHAFQGVNLLAARLLYPYLAWVTFASALNYSYWTLNT